jgi:hypothetical protein
MSIESGVEEVNNKNDNVVNTAVSLQKDLQMNYKTQQLSQNTRMCEHL